MNWLGTLFCSLKQLWWSVLQYSRTGKVGIVGDSRYTQGSGKRAIKYHLLLLFPGLLDTLIEMNTILEDIQKSLDMYLETKRHIFPRFYFLSNDDLLEILGQSRNPEAVQPHLKKCFDNVKLLRMQKVNRVGHDGIKGRGRVLRARYSMPWRRQCLPNGSGILMILDYVG